MEFLLCMLATIFLCDHLAIRKQGRAGDFPIPMEWVLLMYRLRNAELQAGFSHHCAIVARLAWRNFQSYLIVYDYKFKKRCGDCQYTRKRRFRTADTSPRLYTSVIRDSALELARVSELPAGY
jgi:hypothetical protein